MGPVDWETYQPMGYNYGFGPKLRFAAALRHSLKGRSLDDPELERYERAITSQDWTPYEFHGRKIPPWAILDYHKLLEINPDYKRQILNQNFSEEDIPELSKMLRHVNGHSLEQITYFPRRGSRVA